MTLEIFSHAQEIATAQVVRLGVPETEICLSEQNTENAKEANDSASCSQNDQKHDDGQPSSANADASHHQVIIPSLYSYHFQKVSLGNEPIAFRSAEPLHISLPPPYTPPKFS